MGRLAVKYGSFINLLLMEAWFCYSLWGAGSPDWEPAIVFITSLGALIYLEFKDQTTFEESDRDLFHHFMETLPYEGSIEFIDRTSMDGQFDQTKHDDMRNFFYHWDDAAHEFLDPKIEKRRKYLWNLIEEYVMLLDKNTVPLENGLRSVPPEWRDEQPERYRETVNSFHAIAGQIVLAHQEMVRFAKKKLKVL